MARKSDNLPGHIVDLVDGNVNEKLAKFINLFQPAAKRVKGKSRTTSSFQHSFDVNVVNVSLSIIGNEFVTTFVPVIFLSEGFEYSETWPDTIPDIEVHPSVSFLNGTDSIGEGFEYAESWLDTIPNEEIQPSIDFSSPDNIKSDGFEYEDAWPNTPAPSNLLAHSFGLYIPVVTAPTFLAHMNDSSFIDEMGHAVLASTSTLTPGLFGNGAAFTGSEYLHYDVSDGSLDFGNNPFTIEVAAFFNDLSGNQFLVVSHRPFQDITWQLALDPGLGGRVGFYNGGYVVSDPNSPPIGTPVRYAVTKTGSTIRMFRDGILVSTGSSGAIGNSSGRPLGIGGPANTNPGYSIHGWVDEVRIFNGTCLYTTDYPLAPVEFLPVSTGQSFSNEFEVTI